MNDHKYVDMDCYNINQYQVPNNYLSREETLANLDNKKNYQEKEQLNSNPFNSTKPNIGENNNKNYHSSLLSNNDNLNVN